MDISYWAYIGTFYLLLLTYQDYKNNRMVDDRRNWFMLGISVSLISHTYTTFWYKLALSIILIVLYIFMRKIKALGEADTNTYSWIFLGFGLINPYYLMLFTGIFIVLTLLYTILKKIFKIQQPVQFYGVLLISYSISCFLLGIF